MPERIRLSELADMTTSEVRAATASLAQAQRTVSREGSPSLDARIRAFERRYEMTSAVLLQRLRSGDQRETADICDWLLLLAARDPDQLAIR